MIRLFACVLALLASVAHAKVFGVVESQGNRIEFHDEPGICLGGAMRAEFIDRSGERIPGCWTQRSPGVLGVVFLDGDVATVPMAAVRPPAGI